MSLPSSALPQQVLPPLPLLRFFSRGRFPPLSTLPIPGFGWEVVGLFPPGFGREHDEDLLPFF